MDIDFVGVPPGPFVKIWAASFFNIYSDSKSHPESRGSVYRLYPVCSAAGAVSRNNEFPPVTVVAARLQTPQGRRGYRRPPSRDAPDPILPTFLPIGAVLT